MKNCNILQKKKQKQKKYEVYNIKSNNIGLWKDNVTYENVAYIGNSNETLYAIYKLFTNVILISFWFREILAR